MNKMARRGGISDDVRVRGDVFMDGLLDVLRWVHAAKGIKPDVAQFRASMGLVEVGRLVQERRFSARRGTSVIMLDVSNIPECVIAPLRAYLFGLPGFDPRQPADRQPSDVPMHEHNQVLRVLSPKLDTCLM